MLWWVGLNPDLVYRFSGNAALSVGNVQDLRLDSGDALESLADCLDPSILSIFEEPSANGKSRLEEENDATLLTALTEILDNVDDDNLSPFDTLPDSEFLSGQKGRGQSPTEGPDGQGKVWEDCSWWETLGPVPQQSISGDADDCTEATCLYSTDSSHQELSLALGEDGNYVSVTLGDLVKNMHPYCMPVSLESAEGVCEQMLPEGGILLEVVDQGEQGEPILAIPDLNFSVMLLKEATGESEQRVPEEESTVNAPREGVPIIPVTPSNPTSIIQERKEKVVMERPKDETSEKCPSRRKKKRKTKENTRSEGRVLRSTSAKQCAESISQKTPGSESKSSKKKKVTFALPGRAADPEHLKEEEIREDTEQPEKQEASQEETTTEKVLDEPAKIVTELDSTPTPLAAKETPEPEAEVDNVQASITKEASVSKQSESKPKPLSLQQYRLLRQKRKPVPKENQEDHSTKWPTLPEPPTELPPLPCLVDPNPRDPRKPPTPQVVTKTAPEITPVWQPLGSNVPPIPKALLVPLGSSLAASNKPAANPSKEQVAQPTPNSATSTKEVPSPRSQAPVGVPQGNSSSVYQSPQPGPVKDKATSLQVVTNGVVIQEPSGQRMELNQQQQQRGVATEAPQLSPPSSEPKIQSKTLPQTTTTATPQGQSGPTHLKTAADHPDNHPLATKPTVVASQPQTVAILPGPVLAQVEISKPQQAIPKNAPQVQTPPSDDSSATRELIQSFTSEIGIEATDLTSLLEQFEETQAKEEQRVPEVCGRAATVGSSRSEQQVDRKSVEHTWIPDLGSSAGLTPPATPPHPTWKPLAPVALLGNPKVPKQSPSKATKNDTRLLPFNATGSKPTMLGALARPSVSTDHDYCLPRQEAPMGELDRRWNVKRQASITIKPIERPSPRSVTVTVTAPGKLLNQPLDHRTEAKAPAPTGSVFLSPESSPHRPEVETAQPEEKCPKSQFHYSEKTASSPRRKRGRASTHYRVRSPSSDTGSSDSSSRPSSQSPSRSPHRKRYRSRRSDSSSSSGSSSRSRSRSRSRSHSRSRCPPRRRRYSYSSSRSGSWSRSCSRSRSRSRSRSPRGSQSRYLRNGNGCHSPTYRQGYRYDTRESFRHEDTKVRKEKAIEERRVVYVGRIRGGMSRSELKERFSLFGEIEECTLHFRDHGDNYGFVTYYNTKDAFNAIENGSKLRQPDELPFDLCFGGRRQFCKSSYADLDSNRDYDPLPTKGKFDALDFDTLLKQAQKGLRR
ncbi:hypothetical protein JZ751_019804 [Albula glossodonta]|uniref:RRM domain-containing protein n=1 Tax=Albula glossodonta TaxID=121402 RepID=A0A8T2NPC3_9TELE|nr:hypothetical protein JZ751_019804 [Albula glossodonta]